MYGVASFGNKNTLIYCIPFGHNRIIDLSKSIATVKKLAFSRTSGVNINISPGLSTKSVPTIIFAMNLPSTSVVFSSIGDTFPNCPLFHCNNCPHMYFLKYIALGYHAMCTFQGMIEIQYFYFLIILSHNIALHKSFENIDFLELLDALAVKNCFFF